MGGWQSDHLGITVKGAQEMKQVTPETNELAGRDVRIDYQGHVFVKVHRGFWRKQSQWQQIALDDVHINAWYPDQIDTIIGRFSINDLGIDQATLAKRLGITRLDAKRAQEIWQSPQSMKGDSLAIDFESEELTFSRLSSENIPTLVFPLSSIAAVVVADPPYLARKHDRMNYTWLVLGNFPLSAAELAEKLGVPLRESFH